MMSEYGRLQKKALSLFHKIIQLLAVNQNTALWEKFLLPDGLGLDGHNDLWKNFVFNK